MNITQFEKKLDNMADKGIFRRKDNEWCFTEEFVHELVKSYNITNNPTDSLVICIVQFFTKNGVGITEDDICDNAVICNSFLMTHQNLEDLR